jgi:hypothetical protein
MRIYLISIKPFIMFTNVFKEEKATTGTISFLPSVSLFLPFEPMAISKSKLEHGLKMALEKVKHELNSKFPRYIVKPALTRLKAILSSLEYTSLKKSIAIYISPFVEKIYYLDIPLKEKVVVNETFAIRDLVLSKKEEKKYILLALDGGGANIYLGNGDNLNRVITNVSEQVNLETDNETTNAHIQKLRRKSFLKQVDDGLAILLKAYTLPVFIITSPKIMDEYIKVSKNKEQILEYINKNLDDRKEQDIKEFIYPCLSRWAELKEKNLMLQLDKALNNGKLTVGIGDVWKAAKEQKATLLIVEKDYSFAVQTHENEETNHADDPSVNEPAHTIDAVDDAIENVLAGGGDVEFVERGTLGEYMHIVLIRH